MTMRLMSRALQLAERGWYVFPLRPGDKRPMPGFTKWEHEQRRIRRRSSGGGPLLRTTLVSQPVQAGCW